MKQVAYFTWGPNCWLSSDGTVDCWNPDDVPEQVRDQSHQAVSVGSNYACVVDPDSAIVCWTNVGVIPTPAGEFKDVAAGGYSLVCGIRTDGSLLCWTYGGRLQSAPSGPYRIVRDDRSHRYVSADATYVKGYCAVRENGEILCELNVDNYPGLTSILRAEPPSATFEHLSLGYRPGAARPCGLTSQGRIQCRTQTWYPALTNPDWLPRLSDNPALKSLVVDGLRLVPQFNATVSSYAATAEVDEERLTLLATTADSRSSMSISHADADPDTDGHQVDFAVGVTVIRFSILAEDGVSAKTYKLVVTRARPDPDDASLSQLRISDVGLNPDFVAERINYETSLVAEVTRLTVEAVPTAPGATVVITPTDADPDTPEHEIDLGRRDFKIRVKVTAPDETTSRTYQVQLFDDRLRLLSVGHVNIELTPTTTEYSIAVPEEVTEVGLNYGRQNSTYRPKRGPHVSYGQRDIGPGVAGHQIPLQAGVTNVAVTAWSKHRLTSQVYNLAITRAAPAAAADAKLSMLQLSEGTPITFDPLVGWYWVTDVGESVESLPLHGIGGADRGERGGRAARRRCRSGGLPNRVHRRAHAGHGDRHLNRRLSNAHVHVVAAPQAGMGRLRTRLDSRLRAAFRRTDHLFRRRRPRRGDALQFCVRAVCARPLCLSRRTRCQETFLRHPGQQYLPLLDGRQSRFPYAARPTKIGAFADLFQNGAA